ncbi:hypothetical protein SH449x_004898 [Pirellulaceae bacterium SH449]
MSRRKRRSDTMAPALFPFLAVLLCTIGALIMVLAISVTSSHASAKREAELALLEAKDESNQIKALSNELAFQREEMKKDVEKRRQALQEIEDHIARLRDELKSLEQGLRELTEKNSEGELTIEQKEKRIEDLKRAIEDKKQEIEEEIANKKDRRPAFAIMPYTGRSGTTRRPVYIECTKEHVIIQPEGIKIDIKDLTPPGPGNPLATALRVLRNAYSERDANYGFTQPPYPLLIIRPDGIESYARARAAMSSWDDQFGYELVEDSMELAFPPGIPGLEKTLVSAVEDAKQRQRALVLANPRLAREQELSLDSWDDPSSSNSSMRSDFGSGSSSGSSRLDGVSEGDWKMVSPVVGFQGGGSGGSGGSQGAGAGSIPSGIATDGKNLPVGSEPLSSGQGSGLSSSGLQSGSALDRSSMGEGAFGDSGSESGEQGGVAGGSAAGGSQTRPDQFSGSTDSAGGAQAMSAGSSQSGMSAGSSGSNSLDLTGSQATDFRDQRDSSQTTPLPQSVNQQSGDEKTATDNHSQDASNQGSRARHVSADGDLKPISVSAGRNWAQAKAEGKATPVTRTIKIVALKDKWLVMADSSKMEIEATILHQDRGPQAAADDLAKAIRSRVDAWGPSVPGGFWVPTVEIHQASDAQLSVGRMERLLEGSGVELKIVPLQLPKN